MCRIPHVVLVWIPILPTGFYCDCDRSDFSSFPFRCLKFLGSRHPTLVLPLVPELLNTHPYFDTPEPDMDDPACILEKQKPDHDLTWQTDLILQRLKME